MSDEGTRIMAPGTPPGASVTPPGGGASAGAIGPGSLVANTYVLERRLGGGGMGEVYLARHTSLKTEHAVKMIRPSMVENTQVMDLFYREARVLRKVRHDAVVNYDGFVRDDHGREFLVMEYVEGSSLSDRLKDAPCDPAEVLTLRERLCAGLAEAHRRGAVHRDLSPDNVILPQGRFEAAKLIDFGLCKLTDAGQETIVGDSFAGKYRYASPEQFGLYGGTVDARSDIYSLGLVLAAAARGRPLDMGDSLGAAITARRQVPDLSQVPPALRDWLSAMLQPDPADRPAEITALLARWPASTVLAAPGTVKPDRDARLGAGADTPPGAAPARRRLSPVLGLILLGGVALGGGLYRVLRPLPVPPPPAGPIVSVTPADTKVPAPPAVASPPAGPVVNLAPVQSGPPASPTGEAASATPSPISGPTPGPAADTGASTRPPEAPPAQPPERTPEATPATAGNASVTAPDRGAASDGETAVPATVGVVLRSFQCPALQASQAPGGGLVVTGQVRSGEKANLYERLSQVHPARVDVTAVTTQPWPRCAVAPGVTARMTPAAAGNAPRIALGRDKTSFRLGEHLDIRILSNAPRAGRISLVYVDSVGEAFRILPYAGEPDAIAARGTLAITQLVAERPVGPALLVATWCSGALYREPPPEKQPVDQFMSELAAALDANGADCAGSLLDLEIRAR